MGREEEEEEKGRREEKRKEGEEKTAGGAPLRAGQVIGGEGCVGSLWQCDTATVQRHMVHCNRRAQEEIKEKQRRKSRQKETRIEGKRKRETTKAPQMKERRQNNG